MIMRRNKQPFDVIWLHLDATHPAYDAAVIAMRSRHEAHGSFKLSINMKDDGTEALVKVAGALPSWVLPKPWAAVVKQVFIEVDHDEAVTLVRDPLWEPETVD